MRPYRIDFNLSNVQQNDFNNVYRANTPSRQRKTFFYFLRTWRALRFDCAHHPESIEGHLCGNILKGIPFCVHLRKSAVNSF